MSKQEIVKNNLQQVGEQIWSTADILRSVGIKGSEFPLFMMPVFALRMVESRIIRTINTIKAENSDKTPEEIREIIIDEFDLNEKYGSNSKIIENDISLETIVKGPDDVFLSELDTYLKSFDLETRTLLGLIPETDEAYDGNNYLNLININKKLLNKKILKSFYTKWAEIDLSTYTNSEITTIEEHIKRRWADISADTAGEHYTPDDIIKLNSAIISNYFKDEDARLLNIYDMTCGGGNMLFGVEDELKRTNPDLEIITYGQEINDELFALASIESRFRSDSTIVNGNTLTEDKTRGDNGSIKMDGSVANPPYGVDWKGIKETIENDQTGMYHALPSTSDGQLLFVQHAIYKMSDIGKAVIVLNGSPLFSGDAGSGESEIRKWIFENDYIEAFIQLPTNEFYNTGITTYLWVLNKTKPENRKDKIALIDASQMFTKLKKNMGTKNCEINEENRIKIIEMLNNFVETENCKIMNKSDFYYNKQSINITNVDINGKSILEKMPVNAKGIHQKSMKLEKVTDVKLNGKSISNYIGVALFDELLTKGIVPDSDVERASSTDDLLKSLKDKLAASLKQIDNKDIVVHSCNAVYRFDDEKETLLKEENGSIEELGKGLFDIKITQKKATKSSEGSVQIKVELKPDQEKDYEIIPYSFDDAQNEKNIQDFLDKWVERPYERLENKTGAEVNFNKIFYKPEELRPLKEIQDELWASHEKLTSLMKEVFNG